jgi:hypothetical protein
MTDPRNAATDEVQGYVFTPPLNPSPAPSGLNPATPAPSGATGKAYLQFKFGTVFTTKLDWSGPGDE